MKDTAWRLGWPVLLLALFALNGALALQGLSAMSEPKIAAGQCAEGYTLRKCQCMCPIGENECCCEVCVTSCNGCAVGAPEIGDPEEPGGDD